MQIKFYLSQEINTPASVNHILLLKFIKVENRFENAKAYDPLHLIDIRHCGLADENIN